MAVKAAFSDNTSYWNTPRRGFITAAGDFAQAFPYRDYGGPPFRCETDDEYKARLAKHDEES